MKENCVLAFRLPLSVDLLGRKVFAPIGSTKPNRPLKSETQSAEPVSKPTSVYAIFPDAESPAVGRPVVLIALRCIEQEQESGFRQ